MAGAEPSKKKKKVEAAPPPLDTQIVVEVSPTSGTVAEIATSRWAPDLQHRGCTPVVSDSVGGSAMVALACAQALCLPRDKQALPTSMEDCFQGMVQEMARVLF